MIYLILFVVTINTIGSQLLLKKGVTLINLTLINNHIYYVYLLLTSPYVLLAIVLQGVGFMLWTFVISRLKLGVAFAMSGAFFYILIALSSWYFFGEKINTVQWVGIFLISIGVLFLAEFN